MAASAGLETWQSRRLDSVAPAVVVASSPPFPPVVSHVYILYILDLRGRKGTEGQEYRFLV